MKILKKGTWLKYSVKKYCKTKEHWHIQEKSNFVISKNIVETLPLPLFKGGGWNFKIFQKKGAQIFLIKREELLNKWSCFRMGGQGVHPGPNLGTLCI